MTTHFGHQSGLRKITSNASADSPIARWRWQTEIEDVLIASGLDYTVLRANAYLQNTCGCRGSDPGG